MSNEAITVKVSIDTIARLVFLELLMSSGVAHGRTYFETGNFNRLPSGELIVNAEELRSVAQFVCSKSGLSLTAASDGIARADELELLYVIEDGDIPREPIVRSQDRRVTYVYLIAAIEFEGRHKVGISIDPERRLEELQKSQPMAIQLLETWGFEGRTKARNVERKAHEALVEFHVAGEWFDVSRETAVSAIEKARREVLS